MSAETPFFDIKEEEEDDDEVDVGAEGKAYGELANTYLKPFLSTRWHSAEIIMASEEQVTIL